MLDDAVLDQKIAAVRDVNRSLPALRRLRVIAGDPPVDWARVQTTAEIEPFLVRRRFPVSVDHVAVTTGQKALVIYSDGRLRRPRFPLWAAGGNARVEEHPGIPLPVTAPPIFRALQVSGPARVFVVRTIAGANPFGDVLQATKLPLLVPLAGMHSTGDVKIGDDADACVYFGDSPDVTAKASVDPAIYHDTPYGTEVARRSAFYSGH